MATAGVYGAAGIAAGSAWAIASIDRHNYLSHGLVRNAFYELRESALSGFFVGLMVAIAFASVVAFRASVGQPFFARTSLRWIIERFTQTRTQVTLTILSSLFVAGLMLFIGHGVAKALLVASGWAAVLSSLDFLSRRLHSQTPVTSKAPLSAVALTALVWTNQSNSLGAAFSREVVVEIGALATTAACVGLSAMWYARASRTSAARTAPPGATVLLASGFCCLFIGALIAVSAAENWVFRQAGNPRNVVLIGIDTQRADRMSLLGVKPEGRDLTPQVRRLAKNGIVFTNAISQAPWTIPAFSSVLTGKYPLEHGALKLHGKLADSEVILAEWMREAGYRTASIVGPGNAHQGVGFNQGFDVFNEENMLGHHAITSEGITDSAIEFLEARDPAPFFLFVHYFDPHSDFRVQLQYPFGEWYEGRLSTGDHKNQWTVLHDDRKPLSRQELRYVEDLYDGEVAYTDSQIGRLLDYLEGEQLMDSTAIVLTSDHGEEFMEHGWIGHTIHLYDETIRVPLVASLPGYPHSDEPKKDGAMVVDEVVETRGIPQLIFDYIDWDIPFRSDGSSLLDAANRALDGTPDFDAAAYSIVWLDDETKDSSKRARRYCLRTKQFKFILDHDTGAEELYDMINDPDETRNLAIDGHPARDALYQRLTAWFNSQTEIAAPVPIRELDQETVAELKALGYL